MAKAQYSRLDELQVSMDGDIIKILYEPEFGPGSLSDCKYNQFNLSDSPDYVPGMNLEYAWLEFKVNDNSKLILHPLRQYYGSWSGSAQFVVSVDKEGLGKNIFACPVCTDQQELKAFPPVRHSMTPDGTLSNPGKLDEHFGNTTEVECSCGFYCRRITFDTATWDEYEE